jgi:hypothetical protein
MAIDPVTGVIDAIASVSALLASKEGQVALATLLSDYGISQDELDFLVAQLPMPLPPIGDTNAAH